MLIVVSTCADHCSLHPQVVVMGTWGILWCENRQATRALVTPARTLGGDGFGLLTA